jgi:hypothetical protein
LPSGSRAVVRGAQWGAWLLLGLVFAAALYQGADFGATKPAASAWGAVIGLAAFLAWLAVDEEEACELDEGGGGDDDDDDNDGDDDGSEETERASEGVRRSRTGTKPPGKME